ncbi:MAG: hypothetical protein E3K36_15960 [Candidatus Brocadia sp.]|nr:hypothetical protein [Candidatus Brocadia sp.]
MKIRTKNFTVISLMLSVLVAMCGLLGMGIFDACAAPPTIHADFNADGFDDLVVGGSGEDIAGIVNAGAVNVIYGSSGGLSSTDNQIWHQNSTDILDTAELFDAFGSALAAGDFNGDGFDDLAVGVPGEDIADIVNTGAVNVLYGSSAGLSSTDNQLWHQNSTGILDTAELFDAFGFALTAGDFNGDGFDDLAVGVPDEDIGDIDAGATNVLYGSAAGLSSTDNQIWHQDSTDILGAAELFDAFGSALTAGDFNGDGFDDLAVGVPFEITGDIVVAGAVNVLYGSAAGLSSTDNQLWNQDSIDIRNTVEEGDFFGSALAAGDYDNDGFDDLVVGVPGEDIAGTVGAGAVNVLYGSASGLSSTDNQIWHQNSPGIRGTVELFDAFGSALAAGDFNGDGFDDLAVGVPDEDIGVGVDAGAVNSLYGSAAGLSSTDNQIWHQDSPGIRNTAETNDSFGHAVE